MISVDVCRQPLAALSVRFSFRLSVCQISVSEQTCQWDYVFFLFRVKAAQSELGTQILADFEEAFPAQGSKVSKCGIACRCLHPRRLRNSSFHHPSSDLVAPVTCCEMPAWWPTCWTRASDRRSSKSLSGNTFQSTWCCSRKIKT